MYVIICPMCMAACGEWKGASDSFRDELQAAVSHWTRYYELKDPVSLTSKPSLKLFFFLKKEPVIQGTMYFKSTLIN